MPSIPRKPEGGDGGVGGGPAREEGEKLTAIGMASRVSHLSLSARTIHADDHLNHRSPAVAPPMHVSTTFRYSDDPDQLLGNTWDSGNPDNIDDSHVYSRDSAPNTTRLEAILTSILSSTSKSDSDRGSKDGGEGETAATRINPALTYSSGLSAFHALITYLNPRRVLIGGGYHGCHGVLSLMSKLTGLEVLHDLESFSDESRLGRGDVIHVETPLNPTGEARDLERYAALARRVGAYLTVDATFAPPPLLDPFEFGADVVMHSGTKYFGGHSDMLCGVLAVAGRHCTGGSDVTDDGQKGGKNWIKGLRKERLVLGSVMGSFEGWLAVRSLRTLELRVRQQSRDCEALVAWLHGALVGDDDDDAEDNRVIKTMVRSVSHASLQKDEDGETPAWLKRQMPRGYGAVFAFILRDEDAARKLPSKLKLFHHATSLGGVESLVEWRAMTDPNVHRALLRVSIGIEGWNDLRDDLLAGLREVMKEANERR